MDKEYFLLEIWKSILSDNYDPQRAAAEALEVYKKIREAAKDAQ